MTNLPELNVFWFRRDLRLHDNHGLFRALSDGKPLLPVFIFDRNILDKLEKPLDLRVQFIHDALQEINFQLLKIGSALSVFFGTPEQVFRNLVGQFSIHAVYANHDYEPYATDRDRLIADLLASNGIGFNTFKDQVVFEKKEVVKDDGSPYTMFTPYSRKWKLRMSESGVTTHGSERLLDQFVKIDPPTIPSLKSMGFVSENWSFPEKTLQVDQVRNYAANRDFPSINGTSRLGVHLRFGTVSVRSLVKSSQPLSETFLNELIWRDFYHMILYNFPHVGRGESFKKEYDRIEWRQNEEEFEKWCKGQTGYPIVDAGMRELSETGFMHNRVRMITASFLTKHLFIDWRWGEAWFASKLLDFDLAANNGGWQWAAGSGCDAAPYFRIFNPALQTQKFDKTGSYIRKWVPEFDSLGYPGPMVVHEFARKRCLDSYAKYLGKSQG